MIFVVCKIARDNYGEFCSITLEDYFESKAEVSQYLIGKKPIWTEIINGMECCIEFGVHEAKFNDKPLFLLFRVIKDIKSEIVSIAVDSVFSTEEESNKYLSEHPSKWAEEINYIPCNCNRVVLKGEK